MSILAQSPVVKERDKDALLLIDADYLSYLVAAISQHKDRVPETRDQQHVCVDEESDTWRWLDPLPLVHWRLDNELDKIKDACNADNCELWLTPDEGNFRYDIAVSKPYKSGRTSPRPYYYQAVRDYMVHTYQAKVAVDCEADDMVCTRQMDMFLHGIGKSSTIVGIDKDLKCMFGHHYNPRKDEDEWVTWVQAATNFYGQMITGDSVDSIPGCKGRGPKYWEKLLAGIDPTGRLNDPTFIDTLHDLVAEAYLEKGHDQDYFYEQAQLLHMRRSEGEMWDGNYDWSYGYANR